MGQWPGPLTLAAGWTGGGPGSEARGKGWPRRGPLPSALQASQAPASPSHDDVDEDEEGEEEEEDGSLVSGSQVSRPLIWGPVNHGRGSAAAGGRAAPLSPSGRGVGRDWAAGSRWGLRPQAQRMGCRCPGPALSRPLELTDRVVRHPLRGSVRGFTGPGSPPGRLCPQPVTCPGSAFLLSPVRWALVPS